jgi:arylsulfatase A-like enzyme
MEKVRQRESFLPRPSQKENKYVADLGKVFDTEREESTTFASYNNNIDGNNVIMDDNLGYVSEIDYSIDGGGYSAHPEQHLADRIANFYRNPRRMLELELDTADIGDVAPDYKVQDYLNRTYYPLVIGREWREGITKLKMIEL